MDKTLLKGLSVLETLAGMDACGCTIDDIATRVKLSRSNTHRTLQTLAHAGYIERDAVSGGYRNTMKMFALGLRQFGRLDVRALAAPFIARLAKESGETIHLSVLDGLDVIYIDKVDSVQPIRAYSMVGGRAPAYAVATGKALLAAEGAAYLDRLDVRIERHTATTVADLRALRAELAKAARNGYAVNRGEWRDGVGGVAAPVFNGFGKPAAAIGVSGPLDRLTASRMRALAPAVMAAAADLSAALGYAAPGARAAA